jgi:hypothetical protein
LNRAVVVPSAAKAGPSTKGLVHAMSQVSQKVGEIKGLKRRHREIEAGNESKG